MDLQKTVKVCHIAFVCMTKTVQLPREDSWYKYVKEVDLKFNLHKYAKFPGNICLFEPLH